MAGMAALGIVICIIGLFGFIAIAKSFSRYQKRADANNNVKVSAIQIRNQQQRVQIAKQHAEIRYQNSIGIREAQDEIAKTLTPLYVAFEMTEALKAIAQSGQNNSVIYLPTNPQTGLPIVPVTGVQPGTAK
jgi:uncharacterized membrane protein YhiD involved in acid resistance